MIPEDKALMEFLKGKSPEELSEIMVQRPALTAAVVSDDFTIYGWLNKLDKQIVNFLHDKNPKKPIGVCVS